MTPYRADIGNSNYSTADSDCCSAYRTQGDPSLLEACMDQIESQVCHKEVYETNSDHCDSVTLNRSVYMATATEVAAVIYTNEDIDSTPFRCCLAIDDFSENLNACDQEVTTYEEYEYDPTGPDGMKCAEISYS